MDYMKHIRTVGDVKKEVVSNETFKKELINDPVGTLNKISSAPWSKDKWIYRMVVGILGLIILIIVTGVIIEFIDDSNTTDAQIPTILTATVSTAIGAIAGLLAPQPNQD